jgi:hypothetical protein
MRDGRREALIVCKAIRRLPAHDARLANEQMLAKDGPHSE